MSSSKIKTLALRYHQHGNPPEVISVEEIDLPPVGRGEVRVRMKAAPINPSDLNMIEGTYGKLPPLPAIGGIEGAGIVEEIGEGVTSLCVGQLVKPSAVGTWREALVTPATEVVPLPSELTPEQAAMLWINPPTALRLLEDFVPLQAGDWVVQNTANSAVGRLVIQIAKLRGIHTLNVVRRPELVDELRSLGGDVVVTDDVNLSKAIRDLTQGKGSRLGLNAAGGESAVNVAKALDPHGILVTYGGMSRQAFRVPASLLIFKDIRFVGFWVTEWQQKAGPVKVQETLELLAGWMIEGKLVIPIAAKYPLREAKTAIAQAQQGGRNGKILFEFK